MVSLDMEKVMGALEEKESRSVRKVVLPEGVSKKEFMRFLKLMNSKNKKALESVTIEEILNLFDNCDLYASCILNGEFFVSSRRRAIEENNTHSKLQRRIL